MRMMSNISLYLNNIMIYCGVEGSSEEIMVSDF